MGKSFNDDVFNNNFNIESINGLNISQEAIEENKNASKKADLSGINLDKVKEKLNEKKAKPKEDPQAEINQLMQEQERLKKQQEEYKNISENNIQEKDTYIKKTMIFKDNYLDIIDGIAKIKDMHVKDVLNQLLDLGIEAYSNKVGKDIVDKALKIGKKPKSVKDNKSIF